MPGIGLDPGVVEDLDDLVHYGKDTVVSRILHKMDGGNVTLFAFDAGQELSEHTTKFDALVLVVDGSGTFLIRSEGFTVSEGRTILLPANIPHAVKALERFKMILIMLR